MCQSRNKRLHKGNLYILPSQRHGILVLLHTTPTLLSGLETELQLHAYIQIYFKKIVLNQMLHMIK